MLARTGRRNPENKERVRTGNGRACGERWEEEGVWDVACFTYN